MDKGDLKELHEFVNAGIDCQYNEAFIGIEDHEKALRLWYQAKDELEGSIVLVEKLREALAAYAHVAWSGWMEYIFEMCDVNIFHRFVIPKHLAARWYRQSGTLYANLPEEEKESDRMEADKILAILFAKYTS